MPTTIKTGVMKIKDQNGNYIPVDGLMSETAQEELADIQSAGQAQVAAVQAAGQSQVATIQSAGQTQTTAIQNKGTEILNSLPSDYTEVESNVSEIRSAIEDLEAGSLSAIGATAGQVPTADGAGSWEWATPSGGGGDVTDVKVNGVSVLNDGVANVPIGSRNALGVVKVETAYYGGVNINASGSLEIQAADGGYYKGGNQRCLAVTLFNQHLAAFYGLAKAAGSDEKNSTLPVGQYTDAAKSAIQTMLGISGIIAPVEGATASNAYAIGDAFLHGGALYKATAAIAAEDAIVPGTNCTQTTIIEMLKGA